MATPESGIQASRPTISIEGAEQSTLTGGLLRMRAREDVHGLSNCELEFGNWGPNGSSPGFLFFDRKLLDFGAKLDVAIAGKPLFSGRITAIEARFPPGGVPSIVVLAEDPLQDMRMTRRTRTFTDSTDADVFTRIAGEYGLQPDIGVNGPTHKLLAQLNQSDLAFMRERARTLDADVTLNAGKLSIQPRKSGSASPVALGYGKELRELRVIADLAEQATELEVTGWDVGAKQAVRERATDSTVSGELAGGTSGPGILATAFGRRTDSLADAVAISSAEAHAQAEAAFKRRARRFVVGHGVADTSPDLRAGASLRLSGLGPLFTGDFYLAGVTHAFDGNHGLRSELELERAGLGAAG
jgi:phage protein D